MIRIESLNKYYNKGKSNELHVINQTTITLRTVDCCVFWGKVVQAKLLL